MYNETAQQIETVELSVEQAKYTIGMGASLSRLLRNRDFKKVIIERYLEQEAQRLVLLKADPSQQTLNAQANIDKQIDAVGYFNNFVMMIQQQANLAAQALHDDEITLAELYRTDVSEEG